MQQDGDAHICIRKRPRSVFNVLKAEQSQCGPGLPDGYNWINHLLFSFFKFQKAPYERLGLRRDNGIAITAQSSHSGGSPINQRDSAGFNWPQLVILASKPINNLPETVSLLGSVSCAVTSSTSVDNFPFLILPPA